MRHDDRATSSDAYCDDKRSHVTLRDTHVDIFRVVSVDDQPIHVAGVLGVEV